MVDCSVIVFVMHVCCLLVVLPSVVIRECQPSQVVRLLLIVTIYWIPTMCPAVLYCVTSNLHNNLVRYKISSFYR